MDQACIINELGISNVRTIISINYYMTTIGLFTTEFGINPAITLNFSLFNDHTSNFSNKNFSWKF